MGAYSKLHEYTYKKIASAFPEFSIKENVRPEWLLSSNKTRLELDIFIENIRTAIEIQGLQHYEFVPHFHKTYGGFIAQQKRDREKQDLCYGKGISLVEVAARIDADLFVKDLLIEQEKEPYIWQEPINYQDVPRKPKKTRKSILASKRFRRWIKRKRLREKGLLPPVFVYKKLPGSQRMRQRAKTLLRCQNKGDNTWMVWGGEDKHLVTRGMNDFTCDCYAFNKQNICSHIIKVMMETGAFPKPVLVPAKSKK